MNGLVDFIEPVITTEPEPKICLPASEGGSYDIIIIGGGPAGITASVYLARKQIGTLMITPDLGGQVLWNSWIEKYPGYNVLSGWNLATHLQEQLERQPVHIKYNDYVTSVRINKNERKVITKLGSEYTFKSLIVATGKRSKPLDVPGEKKFVGKGVTYCVTSDAPYYKNRTVAVIGGGNSALAAANELLTLGCTVHLVHHEPSLTAENILIQKAMGYRNLNVYHNHDVIEIAGKGTVTSISIRDAADNKKTTIPVSGVFIENGAIPNSSCVRGVLNLNDHDEIICQQQM